MTAVGGRFESGDYFLSELIHAADIFKRAGVPLQEGLKGTSRNKLGTMVLSTVKNDINAFGKDIVCLCPERLSGAQSQNMVTLRCIYL